MSRDARSAAQVAGADAARDPRVRRLGVGRQPEPGRRGDLGLHRRRPRRPANEQAAVRPRAAAAAHGGARHAHRARARAAASAGPGTAAPAAGSPGAATDDVPHAARPRSSRSLALLPLAAAALRAPPHRRRAPRARPRRRPSGAPSSLRPSLAAAGDRTARARGGAARARPHGRARAVRRDAQALFVIDTSRSMAASSTPTAPTRLDRAVGGGRAAARRDPAGRRRASLTLTDRVLPDLLPVADRAGIRRRRPARRRDREPAAARRERARDDATARSATSPPATPSRRRRRAGSSSCSPTARAIPSRPAISPPRLAAGARLPVPRDPLLAARRVRLRRATARPRAAYRPDPSGAATLRELAAALGGRSFEEGAGSARRPRTSAGLAGSGPTVRAAGVDRSRDAARPVRSRSPALLALLAALASSLARPAQGYD